MRSDPSLGSNLNLDSGKTETSEQKKERKKKRKRKKKKKEEEKKEPKKRRIGANIVQLIG